MATAVLHSGLLDVQQLCASLIPIPLRVSALVYILQSLPYSTAARRYFNVSLGAQPARSVASPFAVLTRDVTLAPTDGAGLATRLHGAKQVLTQSHCSCRIAPGTWLVTCAFTRVAGTWLSILRHLPG